MRATVLVFTALLLAGSAPAQSRPAAASIEEVPFGSFANYDQIKSLAAGANSQHVAFLGLRGDKQYIVRDGVEGKPFDWIIPDSLVVSGGVGRVASVAQEGNDMSVVMDGQIVGTGYYRVAGDRVVFSEDGKHYAYLAQVGDKGFVLVRDGVAGKIYPAVAAPLFSPDGAHLACAVALPSGKACIVLDEKEQTVYDGIQFHTFQFSRDSKHFAYVCSQNHKNIPIVDGKEASKPLDAVWIAFSPDSAHVAFWAVINKECYVVMDGKEGPHFDGFNGPVVFSPDSKHLAYVGQHGKSSVAVLDGIGQEPFDEVAGESLTFSPDSKRLAYAAGKEGKRFIVLDGKRQPDFDHIARPNPLFSPDSKRFAYTAIHGQQFVVVCDGIEGPRFEKIDNTIFSADSRHLAYRAIEGGHPVVVIDGRVSQPSDGLTGLTFSPDGSHWIYAVLRGATAAIVLDGADLPNSYTGWVRDSDPAFSSPDTADLIMQRKGELLHVRVKMARQ